MKKTILNIMLLPIGLWAACNNNQTTGFTPGTYVNHAESAYSIADDTLTITGDYRVTQHTGFHRKGGPLKRRVKSFTGVWDANKQTLELTQTGTLLLFRPQSHTLLMGNSEYHKEGL